MRSSRSTRSTSRSWGALRGCSGASDGRRAFAPDTRAGATGAAPGREPGVPRLRRVRPARGRHDHLPGVQFAAARGARRRADAATIRLAGRVTAGFGSRKVRTPQGRTLGRPRRRKPTESGTERSPPAAYLRQGIACDAATEAWRLCRHDADLADGKGETAG